jgi:hypothetical protein
VAAAVAALTVAELTSERFREFTGGHALISTFMTEAVLLVGVYLVIDEIIQRREARRWSDVTSLGMRALAPFARRPAEIVRRSVDELAAGAAPSSGPAGYHERVSVHADELEGRLRADETRGRSFAAEMRQAASRLEEAIIRWGPTLVEDPDSAELLNLLPDIVDAARSAAQAIDPAPGWSEEGRQRFGDCLLEILENVDELDRRLPS